ncbi:MAG: hypothetical protein GY862_20040 [Gammaproteobacteria bacterium]|nr:hypothetical protein [Gammaproteobacteria bacterium]
MISKAILKTEIDLLDDNCLELAYNILRQFPHRASALEASSLASNTHDPMRHSQPIHYAMNEDLHDVTPFADVEDAEAYVSDLRRRQWQRSKHG